MPDYGTNKKVIQKEVNYLGRDFKNIRENLIEFAKTYFPNSYNDFNEASPGMMFVEMASYVGDVLNYYVDNQFRETLLQHAEERKNILAIAPHADDETLGCGGYLLKLKKLMEKKSITEKLEK